MSICNSVLNHELKEQTKEPSAYYVFEPESEFNMRTIRCALFCPDDTLYDGAVFFFTINIPDKYPFEHPSMNFDTMSTKIRLHPNLYVGGKVCMSLIGTWQGDKWIPTMRINTLLLSISSLLDYNPITHEPGHERDKADPGYNAAIFHELVRTSIKYFSDVPGIHSRFQRRATEHILSRLPYLIDKCTAYEMAFPTGTVIPTAPRTTLHGQITTNFGRLTRSLKTLCEGALPPRAPPHLPEEEAVEEAVAAAVPGPVSS